MSEQTALAHPRADRIRGRALAPAVVSQSHHSLSSVTASAVPCNEHITSRQAPELTEPPRRRRCPTRDYYLIADRRSDEALLIDPVLKKANRHLQLLSELDLHLVTVADTHHSDHIIGLGMSNRCSR